ELCTNVLFVKHNSVAVGQRYICAVEPSERRPAGALPRAVAVDAVVFHEKLCACLDRLHIVHAGEPGLVVACSHDNYTADHFGMVSSAIFSTEQVIGSGPRGVKPKRPILTWQHILLNSKCRDIKAMNHVL